MRAVWVVLRTIASELWIPFQRIKQALLFLSLRLPKRNCRQMWVEGGRCCRAKSIEHFGSVYFFASKLSSSALLEKRFAQSFNKCGVECALCSVPASVARVFSRIRDISRQSFVTLRIVISAGICCRFEQGILAQFGTCIEIKFEIWSTCV